MQQEEGHGECDGPDVGKGEALPEEPGRRGHRDRDLRPGPDHTPEKSRAPHTHSPAPTDPAIFPVPFNNTVLHLIDS